MENPNPNPNPNHNPSDHARALQEATPKGCASCGASLLHLPSICKKICVDCHIEYDWNLKTNQQPLIKHQR
jgi:hypothetical protein